MIDKIYYNKAVINEHISLIIASYQDILVYLGINDDNLKHFAESLRLELRNDLNSNKSAIQELQEYFAGERKAFTVETKFLTGTDFEKNVWTELKKIPYGRVISYKELAVNIGKPSAFRAVGNANSKNPIPIIVPCHRVVKSDGNLGGFSCGVEVKKLLLNIESKTN